MSSESEVLMSEKEIINEIDANTCEWRTGIEHCGDYECMLNKCCDLNCDWYKRRKLEQLLQAKEQECEELKHNNGYEVGTLEKTIDNLKAENDKLKADLKSLEYTVALQGNMDIDNAADLFAKHIAKIENENSILKAEKTKYYQQTLDDEIQINELFQTLQEIKKVCHWVSECGVTNDNMWGYDNIIDLITKAEEE